MINVVNIVFTLIGFRFILFSMWFVLCLLFTSFFLQYVTLDYLFNDNVFDEYINLYLLQYLEDIDAHDIIWNIDY